MAATPAATFAELGAMMLMVRIASLVVFRSSNDDGYCFSLVVFSVLHKFYADDFPFYGAIHFEFRRNGDDAVR